MDLTFQYDVFISHNSKDKPRVRTLAHRLRSDGVKVWYDEWEIQPGDDIVLRIEQGLENSRALLLAMSAHAFGSDWVTMERNTSLFRDPINKERRFITLLLEDCRIPDTIRRYRYIDWKIEDDKMYEQLISAILPNRTSTIRSISAKELLRQSLSEVNP